MMFLSRKPRRKPDYEAQSIEIEAEKINGPSKIRRTGDHHAGRIEAKQSVKVRIREQYPNTNENPKRPPVGSVLDGDKAIIEARDTNVTKKKRKNEPDKATASRKVEIFGKLRRRKD